VPATAATVAARCRPVSSQQCAKDSPGLDLRCATATSSFHEMLRCLPPLPPLVCLPLFCLPVYRLSFTLDRVYPQQFNTVVTVVLVIPRISRFSEGTVFLRNGQEKFATLVRVSLLQLLSQPCSGCCWGWAGKASAGSAAGAVAAAPTLSAQSARSVDSPAVATGLAARTARD
jgi:hypothetical protein